MMYLWISLIYGVSVDILKAIDYISIHLLEMGNNFHIICKFTRDINYARFSGN